MSMMMKYDNETGDEETYYCKYTWQTGSLILVYFSSFQFKFHMAPKSCNPQTILNKASFSCVHLMVHQEATMPNNTTFEGLCSLNLSFSTLLARWHQFLCLVNAWRKKTCETWKPVGKYQVTKSKKNPQESESHSTCRLCFWIGIRIFEGHFSWTL